MNAKFLPAFITFLGVLAGIYVTFLHPPLVLTAGPGDYADARAHCRQVANEFVKSEHRRIASAEASGTLGEIENPFDDLFPEQEYKRCMSNASVRLPELLIQLAVITLSTFALLWATRFLK